MEFNTGMTEKNRLMVGEGLAKLLADTYALYLKTQNFHWNVTGVEFYSLHLLFEKQYQEMEEEIDEIAERVRALGQFVDASLGSFKKLSSINDEHVIMPAREMIDHLIRGHETWLRHARALSSVAEKENDPGTVDLLGKMIREHEKSAWMLRSQK